MEYKQDVVRAEDDRRFEPGYGKGGVPLYLLLYYVAFLVFFTWYTLEFQLPDLMKNGPVAVHSDR